MPNPLIQIANAVARLASEHGLPNRFAAAEIAFEGGLHQLLVGRYLSGSMTGGMDEAARRTIHELLSAKGIRVQAYGRIDGLSWLDVTAEREGDVDRVDPHRL